MLFLLLLITDTEHADFIYCNRSPRIDCIVDGDTFWYKGRKIRIADIDTPEISQPQCAYEIIVAKRARERLYQLLNNGNFTLKNGPRTKDYFGRDLLIVERAGKSLGAILIDEGLAHRWRGQKEDWCL